MNDNLGVFGTFIFIGIVLLALIASGWHIKQQNDEIIQQNAKIIQQNDSLRQEIVLLNNYLYD